MLCIHHYYIAYTKLENGTAHYCSMLDVFHQILSYTLKIITFSPGQARISSGNISWPTPLKARAENRRPTDLLYHSSTGQG